MTDSITIDYLKNISEMIKQKEHNEYYTWQLDNGKLFTERDTELEKKFINKRFPCERKECYYNSQLSILRLGTDKTKIKYYEGWYVSGKIPFPIEHAFLLSEEGKVIDLTSNSNNFEVKEYYGIQIPNSFVSEYLLHKKMACSLLFHYYLREKKHVKRS